MSKKTTQPKHNRDGCITGGRVPLSDAQAKYLRIFTVEHTTNLKYISHREQVSYENVRKMRRKLIELGYMDARYNAVVFEGFSTQPASNYQYGNNWCLNGLEYNVKIIAGQFSPAYLEARKSNVAIKGSTVMPFENSIKIKVGQVFESDHPNKAAWNASEYVFSLLRSLESRYGLLLLKDGYSNIKRVKGEFARQNDNIALKEGAAQIKIHSNEDGKLRVAVDWSPGTMPEVEMMHAKHGQPDAEKYEDFLRDMVEKNHLRLSELSAMVYESQKQHQIIAQELAQVTTALKLSLEVQRRTAAPEYAVEPFDPKVVNYFG